MKHLLSLEKTSGEDMKQVLKSVAEFKATRGQHPAQPLAGQTWAMIFSKSSTRTRVSFEVGIHELGGRPLFLNANDIQLGRGEPIKDTARVLGRMVHGAVIRTFAQKDVEDFAAFSSIPTVNARRPTDDEHPCQILTDIFTYEEKHGPIQGKVVTFVGDGACNVPVSWIFAAAKLDFELRIAAPKCFNRTLKFSNGPVEKSICTEDVNAAADGADLLYTDVWVSMGKEDESAGRIAQLTGYQINDALVKRANPEVMVMHCLPAYRGKEITEEVFEAHADTIFTEAENRLHTQKAIMNWMVG